jgi:hypothetical protein
MKKVFVRGAGYTVDICGCCTSPYYDTKRVELTPEEITQLGEYTIKQGYTYKLEALPRVSAMIDMTNVSFFEIETE